MSLIEIVYTLSRQETLFIGQRGGSALEDGHISTLRNAE